MTFTITGSGPRALGFAWGVGGRSAPPNVVIRGGFGISYDRFQSGQILQAERLNGITQQQFVINNPTCFPGPEQPLTTPIQAAARPVPVPPPSIRSVRAARTLHFAGAISAERQVTKSATLSVTYLNSRGFDQFLTINANAPSPGTPCYSQLHQLPSDIPLPLRFRRQLQAEPADREHERRVGSKLQLFGYYTLNYANSDTSGVSSFPSNSYNISQDYGRASFDTRHRLFLGGTIALPYCFV